eukprot:5487471-Pyramimonas_sp.AAC.1
MTSNTTTTKTCHENNCAYQPADAQQTQTRPLARLPKRSPARQPARPPAYSHRPDLRNDQ